MGPSTFAAGADFIVSSVSAFVDAELLSSLRLAAEQAGRRLQIQTGALGGIDALSAARIMGIDEVEHRIVKPPIAWGGTAAADLCDLVSLTEPTVFFTGTASETALEFPKNANVAMTTALAGIGPERTKISLVADPFTTTNRHEISARGAFGELDVRIANSPLPANPKTSAMAALSLVRILRNRVSALTI
ncbi:MAG: aspartate dehydrogenase [Acidimicrobiales bacterium]